MKDPKVLYILIGVLCILAIIAGVYAQFFVKDENKDKVIIPSLNQVAQDEVVEKNSEEIKTQFAGLFTNVLNANNYDASNIQKIFPEKELIYSAYDIEKSENNYEINVHLPVMNIKGEVPSSFNNITQTVFANKTAEIMNSKSDTKVLFNIDYVAYINDYVLSLVIKGTLKDGNNPQRVFVQTYNYDLETGEKVKLEDILSDKNLIQSDVQNKIDNTINKAKEEADILAQSGYSVYARDINNDMYTLENISNYFLGPNGDLYIIFAYGNNNNTSEMDIILYE